MDFFVEYVRLENPGCVYTRSIEWRGETYEEGERYIKAHAHEGKRLELWSYSWIETDHGYAPIMWCN